MYEVPDASVPAGTVVQVVQAGYMIGERVLRPALVAVSKGGVRAQRFGTDLLVENVFQFGGLHPSRRRFAPPQDEVGDTSRPIRIRSC